MYVTKFLSFLLVGRQALYSLGEDNRSDHLACVSFNFKLIQYISTNFLNEKIPFSANAYCKNGNKCRKESAREIFYIWSIHIVLTTVPNYILYMQLAFVPFLNCR